jgi:hypothetical protein
MTEEARTPDLDVVDPETALLADLLRADMEEASRRVHVPAAGQVWWRAAVRARLEAAHGASKPITWMQGIAGAGAVGFAVALLGFAWPTLRAAAERIATFALGIDAVAPAVPLLLVDAIQRGLPILILVALCVVLAPVALYFALSDE